MRAFAVGFPKHGSHALVKALQLLGVNCEVNHAEYSEAPADDRPRVLIKRDPRDAVVSWLRFNGVPVTQGAFICALSDMDGHRYDRYKGVSLVDAMARYEGWLFDRATTVVRFERLVDSESALIGLADALGVPYLSDAWEAHQVRNTVSWTGELSDYRTIWTPEVRDAWRQAGGNELLARWGY
jgi:hypothetical protein